MEVNKNKCIVDVLKYVEGTVWESVRVLKLESFF